MSDIVHKGKNRHIMWDDLGIVDAENFALVVPECKTFFRSMK